MTDRHEPPGGPGTGHPQSPVGFGGFWAGLVLFGVVDFPVAMWGFGESSATLPAVALAVGTLVAAGLFWLRFRSVSLGIVAGYVLMSVVSGGVCTFRFADPLDGGEGALFGLLIYPLVVSVSGLVAAIVYFVRKRASGNA